MTGPGCTRKHTKVKSKKQRRFVGAVKTYQETGKGSAKVAKAAKHWPSKGPSSPGAHLKEVKGEKLPLRVKKKRLRRRKK